MTDLEIIQWTANVLYVSAWWCFVRNLTRIGLLLSFVAAIVWMGAVRDMDVPALQAFYGFLAVMHGMAMIGHERRRR